MGKLLSIILPVYNVEPYIERCIRSLENQDIPKDDYEIIVVNDGSPDNSREVVVRLMKEFNNIVLIDQKNMGVSMARNAGIHKSIGKYLLFIDPDDYVTPHTFGEILEKDNLAKNQALILSYQFIDVNGLVEREMIYNEYTGLNYSGIETYAHSRGDGTSDDPDRSWGILFQREFIVNNKLIFASGIPYLEDGEFIARSLCIAYSCSFSNVLFYIRTTRPGSATNSDLFFQDRSIDGFISAAINLRNFRSNITLSNEQMNFLNQPIIKFCFLAVQASTMRKGVATYRNVYKLLRKNNLVKLPLETCFGIYKTYGRVYNLSINLFAVSWALRNITTSFNNRISNLLNLK